MKNLSNNNKFNIPNIAYDDEYTVKAATYPKDQLASNVNPFSIQENPLTERDEVEINAKNSQTSNFGINLPGSCDHNKNQGTYVSTGTLS